MSDSIYLLIESGEPLRMVKHHIAERDRVHTENVAMCNELGVTELQTDITDGSLIGVVFRGDIPEGWTKPKGRGGVSYPKKGTDWAKRRTEQKGYESPSSAIIKAFNVPHSIHYTGEDGSEGWMRVGRMLRECGFLWLSEDGPYAMWVPDVAAAVRGKEADGYTVKESGWVPNIPGARVIMEEEWELLVAQHNLDQKRKAQEGAKRDSTEG